MLKGLPPQPSLAQGQKGLIQRYLKLESTSATLLLIMALLAMLWANSPLEYLREQFIDVSLFWINEGLMAVFFLGIGLELKREYLATPSAKNKKQALLPVIAAAGGMIVPALIYIAFNLPNPETIKGWTTPVATDIAFSLGVLSLFGRRVPSSLKLFLMSLAIFDDLGAVIIIALFYSHGLNYVWILLFIVLVLMLYQFKEARIYSLTPYLLMGVLLWFCLLHAGIHPTLAGFVLALTIPDSKEKRVSPLRRLEVKLQPWSAYFIMPLFALANAGFQLQSISWSIITDGVVLGIALGLFIGKQSGIFGLSWLLIKTGFAELPKKTSWLMLYGVALICGIGFTMSLFLGTLAFENTNRYIEEVRLGVITGSILSGFSGAMVLLAAFVLARKRE